MTDEPRYYVTNLTGYDSGTSGRRVPVTTFYVLDRCNCHRIVSSYGPHSAPWTIDKARREAGWDAQERNRLERDWEDEGQAA